MVNRVLNFRLNKYRNLALQKLGRNLYNFNLVERWLKYIVTVSDVATIDSILGPVLDNKTKKKIGKTQRMMLGQLINEVFQIWNPKLNIQYETQDLFNLRLKTSMKIEMHMADYLALKASYETMLSDRNFLIHRFSEEFSLNSIVCSQQAISYLDEMRKKHLPTMLNLQEIVKTYLEITKDIQHSFE